MSDQPSPATGYAQFLRDVAHDHRNFEREPLKRAELAVIVAHFPDVWDEAMAEVPTTDLVPALGSSYAHVELGNLVTIWLRRRCMSYIKNDIAVARADYEDEQRLDAEYEGMHA